MRWTRGPPGDHWHFCGQREGQDMMRAFDCVLSQNRAGLMVRECVGDKMHSSELNEKRQTHVHVNTSVCDHVSIGMYLKENDFFSRITYYII